MRSDVFAAKTEPKWSRNGPSDSILDASMFAPMFTSISVQNSRAHLIAGVGHGGMRGGCLMESIESCF